MSPRTTLAQGDDHYLFINLGEPGKDFLTMDGAEFEARSDAVTVAIPADLWERLLAVGVPAEGGWEDEGDRDADSDRPFGGSRREDGSEPI